ncbi:hypothetical protein [Nocardia asteroides]|uniref:hypothetical protein n=1 Tax=Nocardia asteroides TaxID=1824 RepID=UPI001E55F60E|nr:hypothetical protein [Nocardia asteroides]UGT62245.1 hypothetical protein LTT61_02540 [Nocardia asteroides]
MSTDFTVPLESPFPAAILTPPLADLRWRGDAPCDPVTEPGHWFPHRDGVSTRSLTVDWSDGTLDVTVPLAAAPEDVELALRIVRAAAEHAGTDVDTEYGPMAPDRLSEVFDEAWALDGLGRAVTLLARMSRRDDGVLSLPGPTRDVQLGPHTLPGLEHDDDRAHRLLETMRRVLWPDPRYEIATVFRATKDGERNTFVALLPDRACLLPPSTRLMLHDDDLLVLPRGALHRLPIDAVRLDDGNDLLEPVPAHRWPVVVAAARASALPE